MTHKTEVVRRGERAAWVARCSCGWLTLTCRTRAEARDLKADHEIDALRGRPMGRA